MKKASLLAAAAVLLGAGSASAQDWSGFYVGGNVASNSGESLQDATVGGSWSTEAQALRDFVNSHFDGDLEPEGWSYGIQGGYNWQTESGFVIGGELGYSVYDADDSTSRTGSPAAFPALSYTVTNATEIESAWNARANIGYDFGPALGYVVLGYTTADVSSDITILSNGNYRKAASESDSVSGFTWGIGGAMRLGGGPWSARLEYTHTDFDDLTYSTVYQTGSAFAPPAFNYTESYSQDFSLDAVQVGLNFHF